MDNPRRRIRDIPFVRPIVGGVLVGATVAVATPVIVAAAGFTSAGIAAGSLAASMMSFFGGGATAAGGIVATCQTIGAVGAISSGATATWGGVGAVGTYIFRRARRRAAPANELENAPANALENARPNALENARLNAAVNGPNMRDASTSTNDLGAEESEIRSERSITPLARRSTNHSSVKESAPGPSRSNTVSAGTSTDDLTLEPVLGSIESVAELVATSSGQMGHHDQSGSRELTIMETRRSSSDTNTSDQANWRTYRSNIQDIGTDTDETDDDEQEEPTANDDYSSPWIA